VPVCLDTGPASVPFLYRAFATSVGQSEGTCGTLGETGRELGNGTNSVAEGSDNYLHVVGSDWAIGDLTGHMYSQTKFVASM
jgi:hypothetical protein